MKRTDDNCIFCKLANGQIPANAIYEDEDFKVILDASPAAKGHSLILPKAHAADLFELPDEYAEKVLGVAKKCGKALVDTFQCDGLNVLQNNGEAAGQTVFHFHMHLIPRYDGDTVQVSWKHMDADDAQETAAEIRKHMNG